MSQIKFHFGAWYIDSPVWIKNIKATINPINKKDNKYFQYPVTVVLNYEEIKSDHKKSQRLPFTNKYNWEKINFPSEKDDWQKLRKIR